MPEPANARTGALPPDGADHNAVLSAINDLQRIELDILLDVARVCRELDIEFFLGEGTLLGAIRHGGFIPWDDDIDLIMRRAEYDRFLRLAPEQLGSKYAVQHSSTVADYWSPFIKVRLVEGDQQYRQAHIAHLSDDNGPLIDIFPVEYVPRRDGFGLRLQAKYIRLLRTTLMLKLGAKKPAGPKMSAMRWAGRLLTTGFIHRQLDWAFRLHDGARQPYMATLASYHPLSSQVVPSEVYDEAVMVGFEGHDMPVPIGYDELLTTIYGDYRTLPPEDQRVVKHKFVLTQE